MVSKYNLQEHFQAVQITSGFYTRLCSSSQIKTATHKQNTTPTNPTVHKSRKPLLHSEEQYPMWLQLLELTFQN